MAGPLPSLLGPGRKSRRQERRMPRRGPLSLIPYIPNTDTREGRLSGAF